MKKLLVFGIFILFFAKCSKKEEPAADNTPTVVAKGTTIPVSAEFIETKITNSPGVTCAPDGGIPGTSYINGTFLPYGKLELDKSIQKVVSCSYSASTTAYTLNTTSKIPIAKGDTIFTYGTFTGTTDKDSKGKFVGLISLAGGTGKFKGAIGSLKSLTGVQEGISATSTWVGDITTY